MSPFVSNKNATKIHVDHISFITMQIAYANYKLRYILIIEALLNTHCLNNFILLL